jgi:hypothetical protein
MTASPVARPAIDMAALIPRLARAPRPAGENPFAFVMETDLGAVSVMVRPGRVARVQCVPRAGGKGVQPLDAGGVPLLVVADLARTRSGWALRSYVAPGVPAADAAAVRDLFADAVAPGLDANLRRFVMRDIVEVMKDRRAHDDAIGVLQEQIDRRRAKIRDLRKARDAAERGDLGPREAALKMELAGLDGPLAEHEQAPEEAPEAAPAMGM